MLIPAYRDMDPYDLPEEFSHLQAQDMSKLGFMQDLIRGIKKIAGSEAPKEAAKQTVSMSFGNANTDGLLKRVFLFLEDGKWDEANEYCERVLDINPECAEAYLGKLMADCEVKRKEQLADVRESIAENDNFVKAIRFGDDKLKAELNAYEEHIRIRNENEKLQGLYDEATKLYENASTPSDYESAAEAYDKCIKFKESANKKQECLEQAEICRKDETYQAAVSMMNSNSISQCQSAIETFKTISGWKDADAKVYDCQEQIKELKREAEQTKKKTKKIVKISIPIICVCIAFFFILTTVIIPNEKYKEALTKINSGDYISAYTILESLGDYKDSQEIKLDCKKQLLEKAEIGDIVKFGSYEQDNVTSNGKEDIDWKVLAKKKGKTLLISKYGLDCKPYNVKYEGVTWETSSIRRWLNEEFIQTAFTADEQKWIAEITVENPDNSKYGTKGGRNTQDKIFLFSIGEAEVYFASDEARACTPTAYAVANGAYQNEENGNCWWWLRSPGRYQYNAAFVNLVGGVYAFGNDVDHDNNAVRPALWVDIEDK